MSSIASFAIRKTAFVSKQLQQQLALSRCMSTNTGWDSSKIKDIGELSKAGKYQIQTFNKISPKGLAQFPSSYEIKSTEWDSNNAHAILMRSHKLQESGTTRNSVNFPKTNLLIKPEGSIRHVFSSHVIFGTPGRRGVATESSKATHSNPNPKKADLSERIRVTPSKHRVTHRSAARTNIAGRRSLGSKKLRLLQPSVVFSNNHLLLVNKPPGYHSQPNESPTTANSKKCMLTTLKNKQLGGGKMNNFLLPMHRLDQPCTGILLLAKNSKAGTRVGNAFRKHLVEKDYFVVVNGNLEQMQQRSERLKNTYKVSGVMTTRKGKVRSKGGSVVFTPLNMQNESSLGRLCHLEWQHLITVSSSNDVHLLRVKTGTGAKHQVRAMLAQLVKSPICGDLRYGARNPLLDQSVALHARSLCLPSVKLGDTNFRVTRFVAPIPQTWSQYFSLTEEMIQKCGPL